jgi:hypothetical protein
MRLGRSHCWERFGIVRQIAAGNLKSVSLASGDDFIVRLVIRAHADEPSLVPVNA